MLAAADQGLTRPLSPDQQATAGPFRIPASGPALVPLGSPGNVASASINTGCRGQASYLPVFTSGLAEMLAQLFWEARAWGGEQAEWMGY